MIPIQRDTIRATVVRRTYGGRAERGSGRKILEGVPKRRRMYISTESWYSLRSQFTAVCEHFLARLENFVLCFFVPDDHRNLRVTTRGFACEAPCGICSARCVPGYSRCDCEFRQRRLLPPGRSPVLPASVTCKAVVGCPTPVHAVYTNSIFRTYPSRLCVRMELLNKQVASKFRQ